MTYYVGNIGSVRLRRKNSLAAAGEVRPADISTVLNRVGFDNSIDNILTGDMVELSTKDSRGLAFLPVSSWVDGEGVTHRTFDSYVNINAAGGLRFFTTFAAAVNNDRTQEVQLQTFDGSPILVKITVRDVTANVLGDVTSYTFNTDRESLDTTTLNDKFKRMYSAGLISGSGSIDCMFNDTTSGIKETPLLLLQLIQRLDIGSEFDCLLALTDSDNNPAVQDIYYEFSAMITRSGVDVKASEALTCAVDFVTTGEIRLLVGRPPGYLLKEDEDRIKLNQSLDFLLTEVTD
jgi:hypothetical protein